MVANTKKVLLLVCILLLPGCFSNNISNNKEIDDVSEEEIEEEKEEYLDDNPIKLGLFLYNNNYANKKKLDNTYYTSFINGQDIGSFEVFLTDSDTINGTTFKNVWNSYANNYSNINYKIGFNIKFILEDGTNYNANFLKPDIYKFSPYFYIYLYDDVHQEDGVFYSHLEEMKDDTLLTSIKIYAVDEIAKVQNIILSAFTYDSDDDFDEEGNYRGNSRYVVRIKRNN